MKNYKKRSTSVLACIALALVFCSERCGDSQKEGNSKEADGASFQAAKEHLGVQITRIVHDLPPPSDLPYKLKKAGQEFNPKLVNSLDNVDDYLVSNSKSAINLGVYATDIAYLACYNRVDEAKKYMRNCQKMAERLGIATVFDQALFNRFHKNAGNVDSLAVITNGVVRDTEKRLENLEELRMASFALAGYFLESLHLLVGAMGEPEALNKQTDEGLSELVAAIGSQRISLLELSSVLKETERDKSIQKLVDDIDLLRSRYEDLYSYIDSEEKNLVTKKKYLTKVVQEVERIRADLIAP